MAGKVRPPDPNTWTHWDALMRTRTLGCTDLELTTIGLGTWAIGGSDWKFGWGRQDEREAITAIVRAVD
jgi:aryl-alcohol dehydrogenase-like predicted oxidoreductase